MATNANKYFQMMHESTELKTDALIIKRLLAQSESHPNGLTQRVRQYAEDLSWDGSEGSALYGKVASAMISDGFGTPRDAFPDIYLQVLNEREALKEGYSLPSGIDGNSAELINAAVADQQFSEVDSEHKPLAARIGEVRESPDYQENLSNHGVDGVGVAAIIGDGSTSDPEKAQEIGAKRLGQVLTEMAQEMAQKVVDAMVEFDKKVDSAMAKGKEVWNSIGSALASKKTKLAMLAVAGIAAAGISSSPAQAMEVDQGHVFTQAEMTQSRNEAREAFYNHLASQKEQGPEVRYAHNVLHNPAFQDRVLSTASVQDSLMEHQEVRDALREAPGVQEFLLGLADNQAAMEQILQDEGVVRRIAELPAFEEFLTEVPGIDSGVRQSSEMKARLFSIAEIREGALASTDFRQQVLNDRLVQESVLDMPDFRRQGFTAPGAKERVLSVDQIQRVLVDPGVEYHVIRDIENQKGMDAPEPEQRVAEATPSSRDFTVSEPEQRTAQVNQRERDINIPDRVQREASVASVEHTINEPERVEREAFVALAEQSINMPKREHRSPQVSQLERDIDMPDRVYRTPNVPELKTRNYNASILKILEADSITYGELGSKMSEAGIQTSVDISPLPTSGDDAKIDAHSIKYLVMREGVSFSQYMGEIEASGSPDLIDTMKQLVASADMEWDTSGYRQDLDPNYFAADAEKGVVASERDMDQDGNGPGMG